ncbi:uncharacterized protein zgc:66448 [Hoplias malabaricus]|uniref:uncharacterized protein zgc:66448 n=1 Tax=Hoplias malabaricus TaxID=27720 RepID=UPI0034637578
MAALRAREENAAESHLDNREPDRGDELRASSNGAVEPESESCERVKETSGYCSPLSDINSPLNSDSPNSRLHTESKHSGRVLHNRSPPREAENDCSKLSKENEGHETSQVKKQCHTADDLSFDAEQNIEERGPLGEDDEEEYTDMSMDMECDEDDREEEMGMGEEEGADERKEEAEGGRAGEEEEGREEEEEETDVAVKQKKSRMECRDCGKKFTRRETYNLHRHFHMHQDEQASLTCKECGLTFQHRSSLIKHRTEHKRIGLQHPELASRKQRRRVFKEEEEMLFDCYHCNKRFSSLVRYRLHACQQNLEKPYRCPLCRRDFQYRVSINAHMQSHSLDSPYRCLECNKGFQCAVTLNIHQRSHAALKPYECPDCGMVFRHRSFMDDHRRKHTEERPHQCKICGKNFKYSSLLQQHQFLHTGQKPYRCSECGKRFAFAQNMRAHCRQHKSNSVCVRTVSRITNHDVAYATDLGSVEKENTNHDAEKQRNCPLCPRMFYKAADLREHMLIHEVEYENLSKKADQVHACPYCPLKFMDESTLQSHKLTHEVTSAPLKREVLSVAREGSTENMVGGGGEWGDLMDKKPLKCRDCGKCFRYRSVLELHMRIHNKGYQCHICKKSFRFSSYLQQHLIIHSGKKPYKCPDCGKDFAFLQNMKTHQRLHQQKPFRCTQCRKGYSDESQLQRHMLSHSGEKPHKCHLCDKSFGLAYLLRDHLNTHTGERPHRCQECHKSFPWLSSLLVHQKIHARKRQALNQSYSFFAASQRGRTRGRGRRNFRWISSWPRMGGDIDRTMPVQQAPFPGQILQGTVLPNIGQQASISDTDVLEMRSQQSLQSWQNENQARPVNLQQQWQIHIKPQLQQHDMKQQWQTGVHLKPILPKLEGIPKLAHPQQQQHNPPWADAVLSAQAGPGSKLHLENRTTQDNVADLACNMSFSPAPLQVLNEQEQKKPPFWASSPISTSKSPSNADESSGDMKTCSPVTKSTNSPDKWSVSSDAIQQKSELSSAKDKISLALKTSACSLEANSESNKIKIANDQSHGQRLSGLASSSISAQEEQTTDETNSKPWSFKSALEMPKSLNVQHKLAQERESQLHLMQHDSQQQLQLVLPPPPQIQLLQQTLQQLQQEQPQQQLHLLQQQQFHQSRQQQNPVPSVWEGAPQPNQVGTISIQFGGTRFAPGPGNTVWGFQTTPVVSPALLNGPIPQGPVRAQQQAPVVSGPQILLNQTSPFISPPLPLPSPLSLPGSHPIHTVASQAPQGIFFTPQGMVTERPVIPQALASPHLTQQTGPDRRFHCLVCGCTLPGELELQVHYMQHAQGEI